MTGRKIWTALIWLFAISVLLFCSSRAMAELSLTATTDKDIYSPGEMVNLTASAPDAWVTIQLTNTTNETLLVESQETVAGSVNFQFLLGNNSEEGNYTVHVSAVSKENESQDNQTSVVFQVELKKPDPDEDYPWWEDLPIPFIIFIISLLLFMGFCLLTEMGLYSLFSLLAPLYSRLNGNDVEGQETRALLLGYITGNPGSNYTLIKSVLGLSNGRFDYHLKVLLRERRIKSRKKGLKVFFFPYSFTVREIELFVDITDKEKNFLLFLRESEISTVGEIASHYGCSKQNVYPTVKNLRKKGLIFYKDDSRLSKQPLTLTDRGRKETDKFIRQQLGLNGNGEKEKAEV